MRPQQLIDAQVDLLRRFDDPSFGDEMWRSHLEDVARRVNAGLGPSVVEETVDITRAAVQAAYCYRVTGDMGVVLQHAAAQLDEDDRFDSSQAPTACGLVYFEEPIRVADEDNDRKLHWLVWGPGPAPSTVVYLWNDHEDPDELTRYYLDQNPKFILQRLGRWSPIDGMFLNEGRKLGPVAYEPYESPEKRAQALAEGRTLNNPTNVGRLVYAFWLLTQQTVAEVSEEFVRSTSARPAKRLGLPAKVSVVQLRRSAGNRRPGESTVDWAVRWIVRGHWRWQAHGPGRRERKRIWIADFEKGPEDAPLKVTKKIYDVRR